MSELEQRIREDAEKYPEFVAVRARWDKVASPANILSVLDEKDREIERLKRQISDCHRAYSEEVREMARDRRDALAEARWEERQGADYGSY